MPTFTLIPPDLLYLGPNASVTSVALAGVSGTYPAGTTFAFTLTALPNAEYQLALVVTQATVGHVVVVATYNVTLTLGGGSYSSPYSFSYDSRFEGHVLAVHVDDGLATATAATEANFAGAAYVPAATYGYGPGAHYGTVGSATGNSLVGRSFGSWLWDWGDGTTSTTTTATASHEYLVEPDAAPPVFDTYQVRVTPTDQYGLAGLPRNDVAGLAVVQLPQNSTFHHPVTGEMYGTASDASGTTTVLRTPRGGGLAQEQLVATVQAPAAGHVMQRGVLWRAPHSARLWMGGLLVQLPPWAFSVYRIGWVTIHSDDDGVTWATVPAGQEGGGFLYIMVWDATYTALAWEPLASGGTLSLARKNGLLYTSVSWGGATWEPPVLVGARPSGAGRFTLRQGSPYGSSRLTLSDHQTATWTSDDHGTTWQAAV